jgi:hypothetical protein
MPCYVEPARVRDKQQQCGILRVANEMLPGGPGQKKISDLVFLINSSNVGVSLVLGLLSTQFPIIFEKLWTSMKTGCSEQGFLER